MTHRIGDRAKETTSTTGTGSFTTTGAVTGYVTLDSVMTTNGDTSWYCAQSGSEWEVGLCTRSSSTSYDRTTVLASSNSGSAVNFTVAPVLFLTIPASALVPLGGPAFCARMTADQTVTTATWTKCQLGTEDFDTNGCFDSSTNYRFTPNVAGYYLFNFSVTTSASGAMTTSSAAGIYKNGALNVYGGYGVYNHSTFRIGGSTLLYANGTTDYFELWGFVVGSSPKIVSGTVETYFDGHLVRAA